MDGWVGLWLGGGFWLGECGWVGIPVQLAKFYCPPVLGRTTSLMIYCVVRGKQILRMSFSLLEKTVGFRCLTCLQAASGLCSTALALL